MRTCSGACCCGPGWLASRIGAVLPPSAWAAGAAGDRADPNPIPAADPQVLGARAAVDLAGEPGRAVRAQLQGRRDGRAGHRHLVRAPRRRPLGQYRPERLARLAPVLCLLCCGLSWRALQGCLLPRRRRTGRQRGACAAGQGPRGSRGAQHVNARTCSGSLVSTLAQPAGTGGPFAATLACAVCPARTARRTRGSPDPGPRRARAQVRLAARQPLPLQQPAQGPPHHGQGQEGVRRTARALARARAAGAPRSAPRPAPPPQHVSPGPLALCTHTACLPPRSRSPRAAGVPAGALAVSSGAPLHDGTHAFLFV